VIIDDIMNEIKVTPWEVKGNINYEKLIKEFGTEEVNDTLLKRIEKYTGELHFMLRRKVFFSHRDMHWLLDEYEKGNKFVLYTGRGPSGDMHIGHIVPLIFTKWLQEKFNAELYFQITDDEKFLFSKKENQTLEDVNKLAHDNLLDIIALGFKPKKTKIFIDTEYAKTLYKEAIKVAKHLTFSTAKATFGFTNESNIGQIFFTSMQSVPAFLPTIQKGKMTPVLIPCAVDQDPHFRITRDIASKLGYPKPAAIHSIFIPGLQYGGKMSTSEPNSTIFLKDTPKQVKDKINKQAFSGGRDTIEEHRRLGGNPDIDVSFQLLRIIFEPDDQKLQKIYDDYKSGKMLSGELKQICIEKINAFLEKHQEKREKAKDSIHDFLISD